MDTVVHILQTLLAFLLRFLELLVNFIVQALVLLLDFAKSIVGMVS